jgi:uncharacterized protein (DUF2267 family)
MSATGLVTIDRAVQTTNTWLADVARAFGTDDRRFAYRVLRAWLHTLRDRLPVESTAHFSAQLPEFLRGVYYDGWDPSRVPVKYRPEEYQQRFAYEARIPLGDVPHTARTVAAALNRHLSPGHLDTVLAQLPHGLRDMMDPAQAEAATGSPQAADTAPAGGTPQAGAASAESVDERLARLDATVEVLVDALRTLTSGLEDVPTEEVSPDRGTRAARLAHEILLTAPGSARP